MIAHSVIQIGEDQNLHEIVSAPGDFLAHLRIDTMASWEGRRVIRESGLIKLRALTVVGDFDKEGSKFLEDGQVVWDSFQQDQKRTFCLNLIQLQGAKSEEVLTIRLSPISLASAARSHSALRLEGSRLWTFP
jgi:hypothetical protein